MGEQITFGTGTAGYLATADGASAGVIVLQEWWGLNRQIMGVADHFAAAGYTALAPDLYQGRVTQDPDEANHMMTGLDWVGATETDVAAAIEHLRKTVSKVAVMGFCMGGALTVLAGIKLAGCDAAVCYYGIPPSEQADPRDMRAPFQGHFATRDDWCTIEAADALQTALAQSNAPHEVHRYEGDHAFFNEESDAYDPAAADLSWQRTLAFLGQHL
jgi:carboxymethylenebutenolidase